MTIKINRYKIPAIQTISYDIYVEAPTMEDAIEIVGKQCIDHDTYNFETEVIEWGNVEYMLDLVEVVDKDI